MTSLKREGWIILLALNAMLVWHWTLSSLASEGLHCLLAMDVQGCVKALRMKKLRVRGGGYLAPSHRTERCQSVDTNPARSDFLACGLCLAAQMALLWSAADPSSFLPPHTSCSPLPPSPLSLAGPGLASGPSWTCTLSSPSHISL